MPVLTSSTLFFPKLKLRMTCYRYIIMFTVTTASVCMIIGDAAWRSVRVFVGLSVSLGRGLSS